MSLKSKLLIGAVAVGALGLGAFAGKRAFSKAREKGLVEGCQAIANHTLQNPFQQASCSIYKGKLAVTITVVTGEVLIFDASSAKLIERNGEEIKD